MGETEIKLLIDLDAARSVWPRARAAGLATGRRSPRRLHSTYWDTEDRRLAGAGIALRIRRDGRRWIQAVKAGRELRAGLSVAQESECAAPGGRLRIEAIPDEALREAVRELVGESPLEMVCETIVKRTSGEVHASSGTRAELAVDLCTVRAGDLSGGFAELEIELLDGHPADLFSMAKAVLPAGFVRFSRLSKSGRGQLLARTGATVDPLAPRRAEDVPLEPDGTAEQAAIAVLGECLAQVAENVEATALLDEPEAAHQLRVGLRRLRSAFSIFSGVVGCRTLDRLSEEARWLGREVGELRDLDVAAVDILRPETLRSPDEPGLARLAEAMEASARTHRSRLQGMLAGERVAHFLLDLAAFIAARGWLDPADHGQTARLAVPVAELAADALRRRWKKARKCAAGLEDLTVEERHALRKELKKLRYAVEFLMPLYPGKRAQPFLAGLKQLQSAFGNLNDAAMVAALLGEEAPLAAASPRAAGWICAAVRTRAEADWESAVRLWRELEETRRFWN